MTGSLWLGVDVGGTFTDAGAYDSQGQRLQWAEVPSSPSDPAVGVLHALSSLTSNFEQIDHFLHGVTIGPIGESNPQMDELAGYSTVEDLSFERWPLSHI